MKDCKNCIWLRAVEAGTKNIHPYIEKIHECTYYPESIVKGYYENELNYKCSKWSKNESN